MIRGAGAINQDLRDAIINAVHRKLLINAVYAEAPVSIPTDVVDRNQRIVLEHAVVRLLIRDVDVIDPGLQDAIPNAAP